MPFIQAKCTNCGGILEVDSTKDAAICKYCGTPFIVEKAINNYNTTNNITASTVNVYGDTCNKNNLIRRINDYCMVKQYDEAIKICKLALSEYPADRELLIKTLELLSTYVFDYELYLKSINSLKVLEGNKVIDEYAIQLKKNIINNCVSIFRSKLIYMGVGSLKGSWENQVKGCLYKIFDENSISEIISASKCYAKVYGEKILEPQTIYKIVEVVAIIGDVAVCRYQHPDPDLRSFSYYTTIHTVPYNPENNKNEIEEEIRLRKRKCPKCGEDIVFKLLKKPQCSKCGYKIPITSFSI